MKKKKEKWRAQKKNYAKNSVRSCSAKLKHVKSTSKCNRYFIVCWCCCWLVLLLSGWIGCYLQDFCYFSAHFWLVDCYPSNPSKAFGSTSTLIRSMRILNSHAPLTLSHTIQQKVYHLQYCLLLLCKTSNRKEKTRTTNNVEERFSNVFASHCMYGLVWIHIRFYTVQRAPKTQHRLSEWVEHEKIENNEWYKY